MCIRWPDVLWADQPIGNTEELPHLISQHLSLKQPSYHKDVNALRDYMGSQNINTRSKLANTICHSIQSYKNHSFLQERVIFSQLGKRDTVCSCLDRSVHHGRFVFELIQKDGEDIQPQRRDQLPPIKDQWRLCVIIRAFKVRSEVWIRPESFLRLKMWQNHD